MNYEELVDKISKLILFNLNMIDPTSEDEYHYKFVEDLLEDVGNKVQEILDIDYKVRDSR